jgi:hypothetical protein
MSVIAAALCRLERNEPPSNRVHINFDLYGLFPRLQLDSENFNFRVDDFTDVAAWRQLGRAIKNNPTIKVLFLANNDIGPRDDRIERSEVSAAECYEAFFIELKNNTSIERLGINSIDPVLQMFDLGYFLQNNTNLKYLTLRSRRLVTPEQVNFIASALAGVQLRSFDIEYLQNGDNGAFEQIMSACSGVEKLGVKCYTHFKFIALAALLRNPLSMLQILIATDIDHGDMNIDELSITSAQSHQLFDNSDIEDDEGSVEIDADMAVNEISQSLAYGLAGNTKLRKLFLNLDTRREFDLDMLLCNSTTLQNICNSNHTLEHVDHSCTSFTSECLKLNRNENKNIVIQNKVMQFYFVGSFDLAPFASMPHSVLAKVMSVGQAMRNKQTAIFELLRGIPELCNVSSRRK